MLLFYCFNLGESICLNIKVVIYWYLERRCNGWENNDFIST